jgi:glycosyltransferase involved in cell wall biosynthesis
MILNPTNNAKAPTVSIILPTYNRASFITEAFDAIRSQRLEDWELIVVDDGSTDDTARVVETWRQGIRQTVCYVRQENRGPYGARNTGLDLATGTHIAFYDSDDLWLPHHLSDCVAALEANPEVAWVYGACSMVTLPSGRELSPSTFQENGHLRPFRRLRGRAVGRLFVIEDPEALECQLRAGLYCGLQNSVIRRSVFDAYRFEASSRNEAEDQLLVLRALAAGHRLAYFDAVHVVYRVHNANSSGAALGASLERRLQIYQTLVRGFETFGHDVPLTRPQQRELNRRIAHEYFWNLGYMLLWQHGRRKEALAIFRQGLRSWPWDWRCWKTYFGAALRTYCLPQPRKPVAQSLREVLAPAESNP